MKTLYLHIGTPKTGTTSIQNFCYSNRKLFEEMGYCYPVLPFRYPGKLPERNALFLSGVIHDEEGKRDHQEEARRLQEGFAVVSKAFEKYDNVVLSDEAVWMTAFGRRKKVWKEIQEAAVDGGYVVKIIVYLRRQDEFVESWWNQRIKSDMIKYNVMKWDDFIENYAQDAIPDYHKALSSVADLLGPESIIVRRFSRSEFEDGSIQKDFINAIGLHWSDKFVLPEEKESLNSRLLGNAIEIKRVINTIPDMSWSDNRFFREVALADTAAAGDQYPCAWFSQEEAKQYLQQFEEGNQKIVDEYLKDGRPLFSDKIKDLPKWDIANPFFNEDMIRFMAISDLELLHRIEALQEQNIKMKEQLDQLEKKVKCLESEQERLKGTLKHPLRTLVWKIKKVLKHK